MNKSENQNRCVAQDRSEIFWAISDTWILTKRSLLHIIKNGDQILGLTVQPVMFMLLFYYVFGGAIEIEGAGYLNFLIPGILVQSLAFGSLYTSLSVATDLQRGITDRFKSLPINNSAAITGHVLADLARNLIQGIILIMVGFLIGFSPQARIVDWVLIIALSFLFTLAISWLSAIMGLVAKTIESVNWLGFIIIFPLTFASAAFVPPETMPQPLRWFAENQPVTHIIEAIRALMLGMPVGDHGWLAAIWSVGIIAVSVPTATILFKRHGGR
ncbi:ABC transporter permease [Chitinispirillales bacterium ANBcel5]|uniref:ABC transporter permease n=1 Tax=Cellulosispirillum alkaliphilum TaxID=3039283 RepID=UPI002A51049B|nr:ABC transporter permease [Chitinispirillales bacterium ANBcel5]